MSGNPDAAEGADRERLGTEVTDLCRDLIRIDTSNPPGAETAAAELLAGYLESAGVECELAGPDPERLNLIARLAGSGGGPSLLMLAHTDVVPAPAEGWSVPPFGGTIEDGRILGRGAADMKGELAARAVALAELARSDERPSGDVVLVAESDEERNTADVGASWLVRERPDIRCDYALNEGGGSLLELADGRRFVTVGVGEKRVCSVRLRFFGRGGHASVPLGAENPVTYAATAVRALSGLAAARSENEIVGRALEALGVAGNGDAELIAWAQAQHPLLAGMLDAMLRLTVTPTGLQTNEPANVIPPFADVVCDCRTLPGQGLDAIEAHIAAALADGPACRWELELLEPLEGGTSSPLDSALFEAIAGYVAERLPGAELLPIISPGFNDSAWIRSAFDTVAYGFAPVFATDQVAYAAGMHSADEELALADLLEMAEFHIAAARALPHLG